MNPVDHALVGDLVRVVPTAAKTAVLFVTAVLALRVTTRRALGQFGLVDYVAAAAIGTIVGRTATASDASWLIGATALIALLAAHAALTRLRLLPSVRRFVEPPLRVLVRDGRVVPDSLRRSNLTMEDLESILRLQGQQRIEDVQLAVLESQGKVSVLTRASSP